MHSSVFSLTASLLSPALRTIFAAVRAQAYAFQTQASNGAQMHHGSVVHGHPNLLGCVDSPEAATVLLLVMGAAGMLGGTRLSGRTRREPAER